MVPLQEHHVENIMNARLRRKTQSVCHRTNPLQHLKWAVESWCQLSFRTVRDPCRGTLM